MSTPNSPLLYGRAALALLEMVCLHVPDARAGEVRLGERPAVERHVAQTDVNEGRLRLEPLVHLGQALFEARFNRLDGQGRPAATGTGQVRTPDQPAFVRTSGPDANACAGCHNQPLSGGAGDVVANVFVLAQAADPVTFSVAPGHGNERNTPGLFGAGAIELLAREMTRELAATREAAARAAAASGVPVSRRLAAKGVGFGVITVLPDGTVDPTGIEGVDWDLVIKPFHQKGAVVSLRVFTSNAMNHHHGMQAVERFGVGIDADLDGIADELTVGDVTAVTVFQAALPSPGLSRRLVPERRAAAARGAQTFRAVGCGDCHRPVLVLDSTVFSEPNPYNPPGNLRLVDVPRPFTFDLAKWAAGPGLTRLPGGGARVHAYSDLKRHDLTDEDYPHFGNEQLHQGTLAGFADPGSFTVAPPPRPLGAFLTSRLWDAGDSDPYGHRGDLTTLTDAIHFHGGEARDSRNAFFGLPEREREDLIEFLKAQRVPSR